MNRSARPMTVNVESHIAGAYRTAETSLSVSVRRGSEGAPGLGNIAPASPKLIRIRPRASRRFHSQRRSMIRKQIELSVQEPAETECGAEPHQRLQVGDERLIRRPHPHYID